MLHVLLAYHGFYNRITYTRPLELDETVSARSEGARGGIDFLDDYRISELCLDQLDDVVIGERWGACRRLGFLGRRLLGFGSGARCVDGEDLAYGIFDLRNVGRSQVPLGKLKAHLSPNRKWADCFRC